MGMVSKHQQIHKLLVALLGLIQTFDFFASRKVGQVSKSNSDIKLQYVLTYKFMSMVVYVAIYKEGTEYIK